MILLKAMLTLRLVFMAPDRESQARKDRMVVQVSVVLLAEMACQDLMGSQVSAEKMVYLVALLYLGLMDPEVKMGSLGLMVSQGSQGAWAMMEVLVYQEDAVSQESQDLLGDLGFLVHQEKRVSKLSIGCMCVVYGFVCVRVCILCMCLWFLFVCYCARDVFPW